MRYALLLAILAVHPSIAGEVPDDVRDAFSLSPFYKKHLDVGGFPILSSEKVSDHALLEAKHIVESMLKGREDILASLAKQKIRLAIMSVDEFSTDIPEHSDLKPRNWWDRRARGLGPTKIRPAVSCGEENLLKYKGDPYMAENILVHEFAHAIHEGLKGIDPKFDSRLEGVFEKATKKGLWKGKYAGSNKEEYWAECVQSYFGDNRENDHDHNHVNTREELVEYDPDIAALIDEVFKGNAWQYVAPEKRERAKHLEGFDREKAPKFVWPDRLKDLKTGRTLRDRKK